jgi:hypothetical protein
LIAVDLSFNRGASDEINPFVKYSNKIELYGCFEQIDLEKYNIQLKDTQDFSKSRNFVLEVKKRSLLLYQAWYERLDVDEII